MIGEEKNVGSIVAGYEVLGTEDTLINILRDDPSYKVFIAIGDNWTRYQVMQRLLENFPPIEISSAIHPCALIGKDEVIGKGVAVMAGVVINSHSIVEDFCILNTQSSIDHDCILRKFSAISPNTILGGNVIVGDFSFIAISAILLHGITVGKHVVIGAGSLLLNNCEDNTIMYGMPAKFIRNRQAGEKYL